MEYLVTMTTHVPDGTLEKQVDDIRSREAAHTQKLALEGHVLRLWRPQLQPGEWRTIGLFSARDSADLAQILAVMPLHVWRTDDAIPLGRHPNDPGYGQIDSDPASTEFLTTFVLTVPPGTNSAIVDTVTREEAGQTRKLADDGRLVRLWTLPQPGHNLGLWQAQDSLTMRAILQSLPMAGWLTTDIAQLSRHPNDPASTDVSGTRIEDDGQRGALTNTALTTETS
ncbi:MAG: Muconolactone delta-isomerase [Pseudonocardiales bacterium]|nr:Muconolactone delta-isomerase [Pseudonocardiales bacterium]